MKLKPASCLLLFVISTIAFYSCLNRPSDVLSRRAMERLMYDVVVAEATLSKEWSNNLPTAEMHEAFMREVLREHRVTMEQWYASLDWYADHINHFLRMNDSVMARLQREKARLDAEIALRREWDEKIAASFRDDYIPLNFVFWTPNHRYGFSFQLDSTQLAERVPFDEFSFRFDVIGIPPDGVYNFRTVLRLEYGDTVLYRTKAIAKNRTYMIPITRYLERDSVLYAADSIRYTSLKHLSGFVRIADFRPQFQNIQLYDIALGVDNIEEMIEETGDLDESRRWWQRRRNRQQVEPMNNELTLEEDSITNVDPDFFF